MASDWTGLQQPNGSSVYGHIVTLGWGNPLTNGTYRIGIYHGDDAFNASYTLTSRGIGAGYTIPVGPVAFNGGTASHPGLAPREVAFYAVEIPSNAPSWKLKLDTSAGPLLLASMKFSALPVNVSAMSSSFQRADLPPVIQPMRPTPFTIVMS